jgi:Protein of unknown function (DUF1549)/Protein of unknown function (DUF1553)
MTRTWSAGWRRWLPWAAGMLALAGMATLSTPDAPAQAKKAAKAPTKTKAKDADDAKEPKDEKKEERPTFDNAPRVVDIMEGNRGGVEQVGYINELIEKAWKENHLKASDRCTDYEFIRRASLDIIGRIPTVPEISRFMQDTPTRRRSLLIERMLEGKEYGYGREFAENFANIWTVMLMTRTGSKDVYQEQMRDWLTTQLMGTKESPPDWSKTATALIAAKGETNKNPAVNYLLHNLGEEVKEDRAQNGMWDMVPATSRTTRLFLGIRVQCVQCHDHPFNGEWGQHHFWGINAFLRQVETNGRPAMMMKKVKGKVGMQQYDLHDNTVYNSEGKVGYERRNALYLFTDPTFLDGKKIKPSSTKSRREELANFITKSPFFAKAYVNRMWGHFMGKSFTKDGADDFGDHNPPSFPSVRDEDGKIKELGLLDRLADDWATKYRHNPKDLVRWVCNSRAYGLSSVANKYNDKPEDEVFFARMLLKPMNPEQLFESLMTATQAKVNQNKDEKRAARKGWLDKLVVNFGNDEGEEGSFNGTVVQALLLMNGEDINKAVMDQKDGTVAYVLTHLAKTADQAVDHLFLAALSRPATAKEKNDILRTSMRLYRRESTANPNSPQFWTGYYQDIFWALLNSNEFILNH